MNLSAASGHVCAHAPVPISNGMPAPTAVARLRTCPHACPHAGTGGASPVEGGPRRCRREPGAARRRQERARRRARGVGAAGMAICVCLHIGHRRRRVHSVCIDVKSYSLCIDVPVLLLTVSVRAFFFHGTCRTECVRACLSTCPPPCLHTMTRAWSGSS